VLAKPNIREKSADVEKVFKKYAKKKNFIDLNDLKSIVKYLKEDDITE